MNGRLAEVIIFDNFDKYNFNLNKNQKIIFWQGYKKFNNKNQISILNLVENQSDVIKNVYLEWINCLGNLKSKNDLKLYEELQLRDKYSFWWQTYFVEKSNYEHSPQINDAIKLIAFQIWLKNENVKKIRIFTKNKGLVSVIEELCSRKKISFNLETKLSLLSNFILRKFFFKIIPHEIKGILWLLRKINYAFPKKDINLETLGFSNPDVVFVDYLCNFNSNSLKKGFFKSNYWGDLNKVLNQKSIKSNWIHLSLNLGKNENQFSNSSDIKRKFKMFNKNSRGLEKHLLLDSFISLKVLKLSFLDWFKIRKKCKNIHKKFQILRVGDLNLFHLYKDEWEESFRGVSAISTILDFNLFSSIFSNLKKESMLIYLFENQPWEFAMIQAWRKFNKGKLIGYSHSSIAYWDLRKFFHHKTFLNKDFPSPDIYALNGKLSKQIFQENKIQKKKILNIEATRYQYLSEFFNNFKRDFQNGSTKKSFNLLVVCDYSDYYTKRQLEIISNLDEEILKEFSIIIKPHPASINNFQNFNKEKYPVTFNSISKLVNQVDLVFLSSTTTAALEFYALGIETVCLLDQRNLNMSPLRNKKDVKFVSSLNEFKTILENYKPNKLGKSLKDVFYLNNKLSLWHSLIIQK